MDAVKRSEFQFSSVITLTCRDIFATMPQCRNPEL